MQRACHQVGANADVDESSVGEKQLGRGQRAGHEGRQIGGEKELG